MDLALNNLQMLICHKTQTNINNEVLVRFKIIVLFLSASNVFETLPNGLTVEQKRKS